MQLMRKPVRSFPGRCSRDSFALPGAERWSKSPGTERCSATSPSWYHQTCSKMLLRTQLSSEVSMMLMSSSAWPSISSTRMRRPFSVPMTISRPIVTSSTVSLPLPLRHSPQYSSGRQSLRLPLVGSGLRSRLRMEPPESSLLQGDFSGLAEAWSGSRKGVALRTRTVS